MPRRRIHIDIKDLVYHYISSYYRSVENKPSIRVDLEGHAKLVYTIDNFYKDALRERGDQFDYEENKDKFVEAIELRTGFQAKIQAVKEKVERNRELFNKVVR